jgi:hypothetical protein
MGWIDAFNRRGGPGGGSRRQHIRGGVGRDPLSPGISAASASRRSGSRDGQLRARPRPLSFGCTAIKELTSHDRDVGDDSRRHRPRERPAAGQRHR